VSDTSEVARNVERDLMERKARQFHQRASHPPLPEFADRHAPAAIKKPLKKRSATFYHSVYGEILEAAMASADPMHADQLLRLMESDGWPTVDMTQIGAPTLARHGIFGGSRETWEQFVTWAEPRQIGLVVKMKLYNPGLFTSPKKPLAATTKRDGSV